MAAGKWKRKLLAGWLGGVGGVRFCKASDHVLIEGKEPPEYDLPRILFPRGDAGLQAAFAQVLAEFCFDGIRQGTWRVLARPVPLIRENDAVHVTAPDANDRGATRLALESNKSKGLLDARMNEQIGCAIHGGEFGGLSAILQPGDALGFFAQPHESRSQRAVANGQQVIFLRVLSMKNPKGIKKSANVFFRCQPPDIQEKPASFRNSQLATERGGRGAIRMKNLGVYAKVDALDTLDAPATKESGKNGAGNECAFEAVVQGPHIAAAHVLCNRDSELAEIFCHRPDVGFRKMGMIKSDDRNIQAPTRGDGLPRELIGVAGFDDVRLFLFKHFLDKMELEKDSIA